MTIHFATFVASRKVSQITNNLEVHLTCGATAPADMKPFLQIQGCAKFLTGKTVRNDFWKEPLNNYFQGPDDPNYGIVVVKPYCIELCTPGSLRLEVWSDGTDKCP